MLTLGYMSSDTRDNWPTPSVVVYYAERVARSGSRVRDAGPYESAGYDGRRLANA